MSVAKKRKRDAEESILLDKAISVMTSMPAVSLKEDEDLVFGHFVANELRSIGNTDLKRLVKWKIQSTIYFAASSQSAVSQPFGQGNVINSPSHIATSSNLSSIGNQSSGPISPTGSFTSNSSFTHDFMMQ